MSTRTCHGAVSFIGDRCIASVRANYPIAAIAAAGALRRAVRHPCGIVAFSLDEFGSVTVLHKVGAVPSAEVIQAAALRLSKRTRKKELKGVAADDSTYRRRRADYTAHQR